MTSVSNTHDHAREHADATHRARVLLTRSREDCEEWAARLADHGIDSVTLPCIDVQWLDSPTLHAQLNRHAADSDWIVFTSRRGVTALANAVASAGAGQAGPTGRGHADAASGRARIAAVGNTTAAACTARLGRVDLVSADDIGASRGGTAAALADTLIDRAGVSASTRILLVLAENAGDVLEQRLREAGAQVTRLAVYRTIPAPPRRPRRALSSLGADNVFLASPSAVTGFVNQVDMDGAVALFTIGPSTSSRARAAGLTVTREAREPSLEGLLEAMQWKT